MTTDKVDLLGKSEEDRNPRRDKKIITFSDFNRKGTEYIDELLEEYGEVFILNKTGFPYKLTRAEVR